MMLRRLLLAAATLCLSAGMAVAQQSIVFSQMIPKGFCQVSVTTAATLASSCMIPAQTMVAVIVDETANTRWRDDGTAPTSTVGMLLASGATFTYQGDLTSISFVAVSGSPVLDVSFYGVR